LSIGSEKVSNRSSITFQAHLFLIRSLAAKNSAQEGDSWASESFHRAVAGHDLKHFADYFSRIKKMP
jgi:hypothetical protein